MYWRGSKTGVQDIYVFNPHIQPCHVHMLYPHANPHFISTCYIPISYRVISTSEYFHSCYIHMFCWNILYQYVISTFYIQISYHVILNYHTIEKCAKPIIYDGIPFLFLFPELLFLFFIFSKSHSLYAISRIQSWINKKIHTWK